MNPKRNMTQYINGSSTAPQVDDLIVFSPSLFNRFGHVAIVSAVYENHIEISQQNAGPFSTPTEIITLEFKQGQWRLPQRIMGWLRLPSIPEIRLDDPPL